MLHYGGLSYTLERGEKKKEKNWTMNESLYGGPTKKEEKVSTNKPYPGR